MSLCVILFSCNGSHRKLYCEIFITIKAKYGIIESINRTTCTLRNYINNHKNRCTCTNMVLLGLLIELYEHCVIT